MKIAILASSRSPLSTIHGPKEILELGLQLAKKSGEVQILPSGFEPESNTATFDLVVVAALGMLSPESPLETPPGLCDWLIESYQREADIAAICTGAFLLAETGLLDNRHASTHWLMAPLFRMRYPAVQLDIEQLVTHQNGLWCSGGAFAYQDLCLRLIQHYLGAEVAEQCGRLLMLEPVRTSQQPFIDLQRYRQHSDAKVLAVQRFLEAQWQDSPLIADIAALHTISERQLLRRFKSATGVAPNAYLQYLRIEHAKRSIRENPQQTIEQVAHAVGYEDVAYFRKMFKQQVSVTPREYRESIRSRY